MEDVISVRKRAKFLFSELVDDDSVKVGLVQCATIISLLPACGDVRKEWQRRVKLVRWLNVA